MNAVRRFARLASSRAWSIVVLAGCTPGVTATTANGSDAMGGNYSEGESPNTGHATGDPGSDGTGSTPTGVSCLAEADAAAQVLSDHCAVCHADGAKNGGFGVARDLGAIVAQGFVVPGSLTQSKIYAEASSGAMPPTGPDLDTSELRTLSDWIVCLGGSSADPDTTPNTGTIHVLDAGEVGGGGVVAGDGDAVGVADAGGGGVLEDDPVGAADAGVVNNGGDDHGGGDDGKGETGH